MNLLETIRALDAPYVVWLPETERFTAFTLFSEGYRYERVPWRDGACIQRLPLEPTPNEIDAAVGVLP